MAKKLTMYSVVDKFVITYVKFRDGSTYQNLILLADFWLKYFKNGERDAVCNDAAWECVVYCYDTRMQRRVARSAHRITIRHSKIQTLLRRIDFTTASFCGMSQLLQTKLSCPSCLHKGGRLVDAQCFKLATVIDQSKLKSLATSSRKVWDSNRKWMDAKATTFYRARIMFKLKQFRSTGLIAFCGVTANLLVSMCPLCPRCPCLLCFVSTLSIAQHMSRPETLTWARHQPFASRR